MSCSTCIYFKQQNKSVSKGLCSHKSIVKDRYVFTQSYKTCKSNIDMMNVTPEDIQLENKLFSDFLEEQREERFWRKQ